MVETARARQKAASLYAQKLINKYLFIHMVRLETKHFQKCLAVVNPQPSANNARNRILERFLYAKAARNDAGPRP
jgi:hypothetical protein